MFNIQGATGHLREIIQQCDVAKTEVEDGFNSSHNTYTHTTVRLHKRAKFSVLAFSFINY